MTIADQIDTYIKTQLAKIRLGHQITLFNGAVYTCQTDAGQLVDKHMEYTEHPDDMPSIVMYTGKNTTILDDTVELGMENHTLEVSLEGFIESDKAGTEGGLLSQDITCAMKADPYFGGLIIELQNYEVDQAIQVGDVVFTIVKVSFNVLYTAPFGSE